MRWLQEGCHTVRPIHCLVMILNLKISPTKQETSSKMMDLGLKKISLSLDKYAESTDNIEVFFVDWNHLKELFFSYPVFLLFCPSLQILLYGAEHIFYCQESFFLTAVLSPKNTVRFITLNGYLQSISESLILQALLLLIYVRTQCLPTTLFFPWG